MRSNYKFHAIAIAVICVLVTALYILTVPPPAPLPVDPADSSGRAIEIYAATWGEECNPYIQEAIGNRQTMPAKKDENGVIIAETPLALVTSNNVLSAVSALCNGKLNCEFPVNDETMGINPLASCAKKLELSYRCYSFDRLWTQTTTQGATAKIDCNETTTPAGK